MCLEIYVLGNNVSGNICRFLAATRIAAALLKKIA